MQNYENDAAGGTQTLQKLAKRIKQQVEKNLKR